MRFHLLGLILIASARGARAGAAARPNTVERRVDRLEQQLRAVQRRVFPDGTTQFVEPEIAAERQAAAGRRAAGDAMTSLIARVDALEAQLRALTGQVEEQGNRTRQLEEQIARLRTDLTARLDRLEPPPVARRPPPRRRRARAPNRRPRRAAGRAPAAPPAPTAAEEAYNAGYRLWDQRRYRRGAGRAGGRRRPAIPTAAGPAGCATCRAAPISTTTSRRPRPASCSPIIRTIRAASAPPTASIYLGQALTRLNRRAEACRVYDELAQVYPNMRDFAPHPPARGAHGRALHGAR